MFRLIGFLLAPGLCAASVHTLSSLPNAHFTSMAMDAAGSIYVAGYIQTADLPVTPGAFQREFRSAICHSPQWEYACPDGFVAKFSAGGRLIYSTYLGGGDYDLITAVAVDASGNAYVAGSTSSSDFPLTAGALRDSSRSGAFLTKLNPAGTSLVYSTRLPGLGGASAIAVDASGQAHIAGAAAEAGLPVTPGAIQTEFRGAGGYGDGAVVKLNARGDRLLFATYLGGSGEDQIGGLALDSQGNTYVAGTTASLDFPPAPLSLDTRPPDKDGYSNAFVVKLNATGTALLYAARPTGSCNDRPASIALDQRGRAFITGSTCSQDYPVTSGALQMDIGLMSSIAFLTVISADGSSLEYSTYIGGSGSSAGTSIAVDSQSRAVVSGSTSDADFPTSPGAPARCNSAAARQVYHGFLLRLDPAHPETRFATYVEVPGSHVEALGETSLVVAGGNDTGDTMIVEVNPKPRAGLRLDCVSHAASGWSDAIAPGELVTLYGVGLGPVEQVWATPDPFGVIGAELAGVRVFFDGLPAPVLAASADEVRAVVPFELGSPSMARVQIERDSVRTEPLEVSVRQAVPGIFRLGATNRAAVLNEDGTINRSANRARRGSVVTFWATGMGRMEPSAPNGSIASPERLSKVAVPAWVGFYGWPAEILYAGSAPGMVEGVVQINARVPEQMGPFEYPVDLILLSGEEGIPLRLTVHVE